MLDDGLDNANAKKKKTKSAWKRNVVENKRIPFEAYKTPHGGDLFIYHAQNSSKLFADITSYQSDSTVERENSLHH